MLIKTHFVNIGCILALFVPWNTGETASGHNVHSLKHRRSTFKPWYTGETRPWLHRVDTQSNSIFTQRFAFSRHSTFLCTFTSIDLQLVSTSIFPPIFFPLSMSSYVRHSVDSAPSTVQNCTGVFVVCCVCCSHSSEYGLFGVCKCACAAI